MAEATRERPHYHGPAFFSYGFRPFFLGAAVFSGVAVPAWILLFIGGDDLTFLYAPRDWHVHEMLFGFLPAVITGFLLTAIPNWTERPPVSGMPLMLLWTLWLAGRLIIGMPWPTPLVAAIVDGAFLVVVSAIVWREMAASRSWSLGPMGGLISVYAAANILFHILALRGGATDLPERMALALIMVLLALIGGRVTPNFTRNFMVQEGMTEHPPPFSYFDGVSVVLVGIGAVASIVQPQTMTTGWALVVAGAINLVRLSRWRGRVIWREPMVLILHLGYGWLVMAMLALGGSILGLGIDPANAVHVLTTGAVGVMTLAVMTRASSGHTGRPVQAGPMTVLIYICVNLSAMLRVFVPSNDGPMNIMLGLAAVAWCGAYLLFSLIYGPFLIHPSTDE